jgi:DNA topoisomerase I
MAKKTDLKKSKVEIKVSPTPSLTSDKARVGSAANDLAWKNSSGICLVVVESPTKAKTIRKFLGKEYIIESCMGHIRDLPQSAKDIPAKFKKQKWATLGVDVDHDFEPIYTIPKNKTKIVQLLKDKMAKADRLLLATDEDREGESISWHLLETLKPTIPFKRMVFNEITKEAIYSALDDTRNIDFNLVRAQEARRILDRLVGYTISPLLWKKVAYGLSAGRVQSVAVRLVCEREHERIKFRKATYWGLEADLEKAGHTFLSKIVSYQGKRIATGKDFDPDTGLILADKKNDIIHLEEADALKILKLAKASAWKVSEADEKPVSRKPPTPFITSSLQQESNRKLGLSARETMQVAQNLYEQGFITYMRTDSTFLSSQALEAARNQIVKLYGQEYLPEAARVYDAKKVKGAQEAHEAIRPAGTEMVTPDTTGLSGIQLKLYELIWKRTMASQMQNSRQRQMTVRLQAGEALFGASGLVIEFDGFMRAYSEEKEEDTTEENVRLPQLKIGDAVGCQDIKNISHETKPPARFNEASIIQKMEKEGIGRPSTYAAVISTIVDRGYVRRNANALVPTFTAMVVSKLLTKHFPQYVDLTFTSEMEKSLDQVAEGDLDHLSYLKSVYLGKSGLREQVLSQDDKIDPAEARSIVLGGLKDLSFRVGRYGAYVCRQEEDGGEFCASIPDAQAPADITAEIVHKLIDQKKNGSDALGKDPATGLSIYVLNGRYGPYVQLGESEGEEAKPKRVSVPAGTDPATVDMPMALQLLQLPKLLGQHPGTGKDIKAGLGRFGPYIVCDGDFRSIPKTESLFEIGLEKALELLAKPKAGRGRASALRELGIYPGTEEKVSVFSGKYGPYVKAGKINATIPEDIKPDDITLAQAIELIEKRGGEVTSAGDGKGKKTAKVKAKKTATKMAVKASADDSDDETVAGPGKTSGKALGKTAAKTPAKKAKATASKKTPSEDTDELAEKPVFRSDRDVASRAAKKIATPPMAAGVKPGSKAEKKSVETSFKKPVKKVPKG